ncbi:MAG: Asp-tRNA(Asn)/Glu-tRNA(Gln) amidotransferase subunit GatB [Thaumarchaeota archaeon]|nr:Asp-tRNA(Asn)/Glu-tRNA(Gln) amidotransferase subunit GatB [Nitrososphaerota archaeon]
MSKRVAVLDGVKIGLEIHCQLTALKTKLFCSCSSDYRDKEPNELVCPTCFGIPGTLPLLNERAVEYALRIAIALGCEVPQRTSFYRKNYFYPDLPKNFQISQYDKAGGVAIASAGSVRLEEKRVRVRRLQLEEDPGKLTYEGTIDKSPYSLVDYNRAGIALVEIVTEPDFESAREAKTFLEKLRAIVEGLGVSDGELEGAMRCDANVSVKGGARVEIKNISSFKEVEKALNYEILRQSTFSGTEGGAEAETRHWDERRSITISLRTKEGEQDYRYFPEPDLPTLELSPEFLRRVREEMPEVSEVKAERYQGEFGLTPQMAKEVARDAKVADFFEEVVSKGAKASDAANWITGEFREEVRTAAASGDGRLKAGDLVELLKMLESKEATRGQAKEIFRGMMTTGKGLAELGKSTRTGVVLDESSITGLVEQVLRESDAVEKAKSDPKAFNYLVGQVLRLEPKADAKLVAKTLARKIKR